MASATADSPFLKKFEGKITVVNRDGGTAKSGIPVNRRSRGEARKSSPINQPVFDDNTSYNQPNFTSSSTSYAPNSSPGHPSPVFSSGGGAIQRNGVYDAGQIQGNMQVPSRPHPLIFDDNQPSLENLRKITAESKYKDFSAPSSASSTPIANTRHSSTPPSHRSPTIAHRSSASSVTIRDPTSHVISSKTTNNPNNTNGMIQNAHGMHSNMTVMHANMNGMQGNMNGMQANMNGMQANMNGMQANMNGMNPNMNGMHGNMNGMNQNMNGMYPNVNGMNPNNNMMYSNNNGMNPNNNMMMHPNGMAMNAHMQPYNDNYYNNPYPQYHPNPIFPPSAPYDPSQVPQPQMYYQYQAPTAKPSPPTHSSPSASSSIPPSSPSHNTSSSSLTKEQLYFSKQPREVYFKQYNLNDYRKLKDEISSLKLGNLGPDLQSAEYLAKKDQMKKMKEYSKNVRTFHNTSGLPAGPGKLPESNYKAEKQAAKEKMSKVKEYSSKVPKPRARPATNPADPSAPSPPSQSTTSHAHDDFVDDDEYDDLDEDDDEMMIRAMERKHQAQKDNVLQIRKEFGLT